MKIVLPHPILKIVQKMKIALVFYGFSIKIGDISCFLGDSCCNNGDFAVAALEEEIKYGETHFVISEASKISANRSSFTPFLQ